jgi:hypothetical protein
MDLPGMVDRLPQLIGAWFELGVSEGWDLVIGAR